MKLLIVTYLKHVHIVAEHTIMKNEEFNNIKPHVELRIQKQT